MKGFRCNRCGDCCYTPRLTDKDIIRIKKAGYKNFIFTDNFGVKYIKEKANGKCMFLKEGKTATCTIHPYRAEICRKYPTILNGKSCKPVEFSFDKYLKERK
ncbi:MAG: YkgJ family cysteine cluster protein [Nanoarchaeota archaeon]|nr:YkgJ family cysteine cluster protein [Nanoarchaeota archaeon]MBU1704267.1 YkgJ family cysteine cluster protein [Nanoarchaeota archaeon]